jgi:hypothetical protein
MIPDFAGAYGAGLQVYQAKQQEQQKNALRQAMQQFGPAAMQGDQNALAELSKYDPQLGMALMGDQQQMELRNREDARQQQELGLRSQQAQHGMSIDNERLEMARQQAMQQAQTHAAQMSAVEREEAAAEVEKFASTAQLAYQQGPEAFTSFMGQFGEQLPEEFRGLTYEDAPYAIGMATGLVDGFRPQSNEMSGATKSLDERARLGGLQPGTPEYQDYMRNGGVERTQQVPTEGERKASGMLGRMEAAETTLQGLAAEGHDRIGLGERIIGAIPFMPESAALSPESEMVTQAQRDWVRAKLRLESGAVIGDEEMAEEVRTYFPQTGDSPEVVKQKERSRQQAMEQVRTVGGRATQQTAPTATSGEIPEAARAAGVDPELWQYMSPEDQALWK